MNDGAIALSKNVRLMRFGDVYEVWCCSVWGVDFKRSGPVYRKYGNALAAARRRAKAFGQTLDLDEPSNEESAR